jgi:hypothetical protein
VCPRVSLSMYGKSRPHRDSIPGPSSPVASRYTNYATGPTTAEKIPYKSYHVEHSISLFVTVSVWGRDPWLHYCQIGPRPQT